jgi:hypothetical protein
MVEANQGADTVLCTHRLGILVPSVPNKPTSILDQTICSATFAFTMSIETVMILYCAKSSLNDPKAVVEVEGDDLDLEKTVFLGVDVRNDMLVLSLEHPTGVHFSDQRTPSGFIHVQQSEGSHAAKRQGLAMHVKVTCGPVIHESTTAERLEII